MSLPFKVTNSMQEARETKEEAEGWHFAETQQRVGEPLAAPGEMERFDGEELVLCYAGMHASRFLIHALGFAPPKGKLLRRVRLSVGIIHSFDKKEQEWSGEGGKSSGSVT